jgi:hypothetical protein
MYWRNLGMDKKLKWTIIAVSAATAFGFGGLVLNNQNPLSTTNSTAENNSNQDNSSVSNENQGQQDQFSRGNHPQRDSEQASVPSDSYDEGSISQSSPDQGSSSWGQDQFQQAPSRGFEQGNRSSGASR